MSGPSSTPRNQRSAGRLGTRTPPCSDLTSQHRGTQGPGLTGVLLPSSRNALKLFTIFRATNCVRVNSLFFSFAATLSHQLLRRRCEVMKSGRQHKSQRLRRRNDTRSRVPQRRAPFCSAVDIEKLHDACHHVIPARSGALCEQC